MFSVEKQDKGLKLEDFQILKCIGEGAFGEVFLVKFLKDEKLYALK